MARSAERILSGKPLYGPPTIEYVGDNYPPVYFYVCAGLMSLFGPSLVVCRAVSVISTIATAAGIWVMGGPRSRNECTGGFDWNRWACVGLFFAFYAVGGQVYDLARVDMTAIALAVWAVVLCMRFEGRWSVVVAGTLMGLAILTKHNMVMVGAALGAGMLVFRWRQALVYGLFSAGLPMVVFAALEFASDGWSSFYLFTQPSLHPFGGSGRWVRFLADDLNHHGILMVIGLFAGGTLLLRKQRGDAEWHRTVLILLVAAGGMLVTMVGRLKAGGFSNNLCPMWVFGLTAVAWMVPRLWEWRSAEGRGLAASRLQWVFWIVVLVQLVSLSRGFAALPLRPWLAASEREQAADELDAVVSQYSADGPVWIPFHSADSFAHLCPAGFLMDGPEFRAKSLFEAEVARHLEERTWSAIILDGTGDRFVSERCWQTLVENYEEPALPIEHPEGNTTLTGKRTYPQRLLVRRSR